MRNITKRGVGVVAGAIVTTLTLAACGAADSPAAEENGAAGSGDGGSQCSVEAPCEISFRWWGGDARQAMQLEALEVFHEQNPDIVVTPMSASFDGFFTQLGVEMAGRNAPDVITLNDSWPIEYGGRGGLLDMTTLPDLDLTPFTDAMLAPATAPGGEVFAVPTGGNAQAMLVNVDILEEAGIDLPDDETWSWDDFVDLAAQVSEAGLTNHNGEPVYGTSGLPGAGPARVFANQTDGGMFSDDGDVNWSEEGVTEWFELNHRLVETGGAAPASLQAELFVAGPGETLMSQGRSAFQPQWSNQMPAIAEAAGGANIQLLRMPGDSQADNVGTWLNPTMFFAIAANTEYPEAAARLVDFMINDAAAAQIMGVDRGVPFNPAMAEVVSPELSGSDQLVADYVERIAGNSGPSIPQPQGAGALNDILGRLTDEVLFDRQSPAQVAPTVLSELETALREAQ